MKKICSQCRQEKQIQRFNTCVDCLRKSDKIKRNMIKNGTLSKKKVVIDNSLVGKMKSDIFLRIAFNFIFTSKAQAKALGFTDKNDMDFTVFDLAERLKNIKNCQICAEKLSYNELADQSHVGKENKESNSNDTHIIFITSISAAGKLKKDNLRVVCSSCNLLKKDKEIKQI